MKKIRKISALLLTLALIAGLATEPVMDANAAAKVAVSATKSITQGQTGKVTVKNLKKGQKVKVSVKNAKILKASKKSLVMSKAGTAKINLKGLKEGSTKVTVKVSAQAKGSWNLVTKKSFKVKVEKKASDEKSSDDDEDELAARIKNEKPWVNSSVGDAVKKGYNPSIKDDFYTAANYEKLKSLELGPAHSVEGTFYQAAYDVQDDREALLSDSSITGHDAELVRNFYELYLDWDGRNKAGISELKPQIEKIAAISDINALSEYFLSDDCDIYGLTLGGGSVGIDPTDSSKYIVNIYETPLSLGDAGEYKNPSAYGQQMSQAITAQYTYMLGRVGYSEEQIKDILAKQDSFEKKIAEAMVSQEEAMGSDQKDYINIYTFDEIKKASPNYPLADILKATGMSESKKFNISEPKWLEKLNELYVAENFEEIKAYLLANVAGSYISVLDEEAFRMAQTISNQLSGTTESEKDERYALSAARAALGTCVAKMYVQKYSSEAVKKDIAELCEDIRGAYRTMLKNEEWMSDATKEKALEKLDAIRINAVYPDKWTDYSKLTFKSKSEGGNLFDAMIAIGEYELQQSLANINQSVDESKWSIESVDEVNAYYNPQDNSINIIAGILNGDIYNPNMSEEEKLGKIGYVIGHEMSHAFDINGSQFDKDGNVNNWWTDEDRKAFNEKSAKLVSYFDNIAMFDGSSYSGALVQGEAVADMAGIKAVLTYAAGQKDFDYDKFFRACADIWCSISNNSYEQMRIAMDTHPLNYLRVNAVLQQYEKFFETYDIQPGDGMYLAPEDRVAVW